MKSTDQEYREDDNEGSDSDDHDFGLGCLDICMLDSEEAGEESESEDRAEEWQKVRQGSKGRNEGAITKLCEDYKRGQNEFAPLDWEMSEINML